MVNRHLEPEMWKRKRWKRLNFCGSGSTLKKEAGSGSELESIWLFGGSKLGRN